MNASITTIKEPDGDILYPKTKTEAVYDDSNNRLDQTLTSINSQLTSKTGELDFANATSIPHTSTFTPTKDGVAFMYAVSASASRTFLYLLDDTWNRIIGISDINAAAQNQVVAFSVPVGKNRNYTVGDMNAVDYGSIFVPYK